MNKDRMVGALRDAAGKVEQTVGMATGDAARRGAGVVHEVGGKGQYLYGRAQEGIDDAADAARDLADRATDAFGRVRRHIPGGAGPLRDTIDRSPMLAVLLVGIAGYALGLLSTSVRR